MENIAAGTHIWSMVGRLILYIYLCQYLCAETQCDEHGKEKNRPERRNRQTGHHLGVHDKCQTSTCKDRIKHAHDTYDTRQPNGSCRSGFIYYRERNLNFCNHFRLETNLKVKDHFSAAPKLPFQYLWSQK